MGEYLKTMTAKEIAEQLGVQTDAVRMKYRRMFPERPFDVNESLPAEIYIRLLSDGRKKEQAKSAPKKREKTARKLPAETPPEVREKVQQYADVLTAAQIVEKFNIPPQVLSPWKEEKRPNRIRRALLISLLIAPTAASITNMFHVTREITGEPITAALYTVVLSVTALGFTLAGIRSWLTVLLAVVLIGYESFCNLSRLYYGLMGGTSGNPTRFLGTVTDIFGSGSHGTAIVIAGFSAAMLAAVQYSAIFELNKR